MVCGREEGFASWVASSVAWEQRWRRRLGEGGADVSATGREWSATSKSADALSIYSQFSTFKPATRLKCLTLFVTRVNPRLIA